MQGDGVVSRLHHAGRRLAQRFIEFFRPPRDVGFGCFRDRGAIELLFDLRDVLALQTQRFTPTACEQALAGFPRGGARLLDRERRQIFRAAPQLRDPLLRFLG